MLDLHCPVVVRLVPNPLPLSPPPIHLQTHRCFERDGGVASRVLRSTAVGTLEYKPWVMGIWLGQGSLQLLECGVRVGWSRSKTGHGSDSLTSWYCCSLTPFPTNLMQSLQLRSKVPFGRCGSVVTSTAGFLSGPSQENRAPISPLVAGCEILTQLETELLKLPF